MKLLIKIKILVILAFFSTGAFAYPTIDLKVRDLKYDADLNAITFDIQFKSGTDYVRLTDAGFWNSANVRFDFFLESGVEIDIAAANSLSDILSPGANRVTEMSFIEEFPLGAPIGTTVTMGVALMRASNNTTNDLTTDYIDIIHVVIPVTSSAKPSKNSHISMRPTYNDSEDYVRFTRSFWTNNTTVDGAEAETDGYFNPSKNEYYLDECESTAVFVWTGANDNDWNNPANWTDGKGVLSTTYPTLCDDVYIPGGLAIYPYLGSGVANECKNIYFMQGGEVAQQQYLTYTRAHIQYNFGTDNQSKNTTMSDNLIAQGVNETTISDHLSFSAQKSTSALSRSSWHMFANPLQKIVSGDFAFGGFPRTFMQKFNVTGPSQGTYPTADWTGTFTSYIETIKAGDGFMYWINTNTGADMYKDAGSGTDGTFFTESRDYGIKASNGILELPYIGSKTMTDAHRTQIHNTESNTTNFYYYFDSSPYQVLSKNDTYNRGGENDAYRLFDASSAISYTVSQGTTDRTILIGNPLMSTIDFNAFYNDNQDYILDNYRMLNLSNPQNLYFDIWKTDGTTTGTIDKYIPPMQGFFVTLKGVVEPANINLLFNASNISVKRPESSTSKLRSAQNVEKDILRIHASNSYFTSDMLIAKREGSDDAYQNGEDVYKLFSKQTYAPEVFAYVDQIPLAMNFVGSSDLVVPVGLKTLMTGETTFRLTGMDSYDAKIEFVDTKLDKKENITGKDNFEYTFNNTVTTVQNDRFQIRFSLSGQTGFDRESANSGIKVYPEKDVITVLSSTSDLIKQVQIYDIQGNLLYHRNEINDSYCRLNLSLSSNQIIVVKVSTEHETKNVKLLTK